MKRSVRGPRWMCCIVLIEWSRSSGDVHNVIKMETCFVWGYRRRCREKRFSTRKTRFLFVCRSFYTNYNYYHYYYYVFSVRCIYFNIISDVCVFYVPRCVCEAVFKLDLRRRVNIVKTSVSFFFFNETNSDCTWFYMFLIASRPGLSENVEICERSARHGETRLGTRPTHLEVYVRN